MNQTTTTTSTTASASGLLSLALTTNEVLWEEFSQLLYIARDEAFWAEKALARYQSCGTEASLALSDAHTASVAHYKAMAVSLLAPYATTTGEHSLEAGAQVATIYVALMYDGCLTYADLVSHTL